MSAPAVVVTRRLPQAVERELATRFGARLNATDEPLGRDGLVRALREADAVVCTVTDRLSADVLGAGGLRAKALVNVGVGFNHIDLAAARAAGLVVTNTPDVLTDATADCAMTLMLAVMRRAGEGERELRAGRWAGWRPTHLMGAQVTGKTVGIVGFGRIGRAMAERCHGGFRMPVLWFDPAIPAGAEPAGPWTRVGTLDELLAQADVVSLHCPATPETRHLINAERLRQMKRSAFLVNTARGDVVDEAALVAALEAGVIAGAGLDVYEHEPRVHAGLLALERVVLLPHLGSATVETRVAMGMRALENLEAVLAGVPPRDRVA
ncbi:MAG: 2-hydroxyacid dehydrogenase [Gemmatimonadota bacterium]|jgi:lactate dehydrogenase-like 2-hydroxyacid dehydrogenase|nr:D-glycerate dehydrogenase [Gemmatimonadota bacterium]